MSQYQPPPPPRRGPPVVPIVVAVAVVLLGGAIAFAVSQVMPDMKLFGSRENAAEPGATTARAGNYTMSCMVTSGAGQDVRMTFDADVGCADGRTAYERTEAGYERILFDRVTGTITRMNLSRDLTIFQRSLFSPSRPDFDRLASAAGEAPACVSPGDAGGLQALAQRMRSFRSAVQAQLTQPAAVVTWRCTPSESPRTEGPPPALPDQPDVPATNTAPPEAPQQPETPPQPEEPRQPPPRQPDPPREPDPPQDQFEEPQPPQDQEFESDPPMEDQGGQEPDQGFEE